MKELLVSFGGAIVSLAEEHRHTQQRLARVEEAHSGSNSSMRTGREDNDSGTVRATDLGAGPQFYQIGEEESEPLGGLRSGVLPLEDWVQEPFRLQDIPAAPASVPQGEPRSYGPDSSRGNDLLGLEGRRDTLALDAGMGGSGSAQVGARTGTGFFAQVPGSVDASSAQVGARLGEGGYLEVPRCQVSTAQFGRPRCQVSTAQFGRPRCEVSTAQFGRPRCQVSTVQFGRPRR